MKEKRGFGKKLGAFLNGKGFYIVLFLCAGVIGLSAWAALSDSGTDVEGETGSVSVAVTQDPLDIQPVRRAEQETSEKAPSRDSGAIEAVPPEVVETMNEPALESVETWAAEPEPLSFCRPVAGAEETPYSMDALVYSRTMADWRVHDGLDIAADMGAQVMAAASGTVERVYADDMYGTTVVIDHGDGLKSVYSNLAAEPTVSEGDAVTVGAVIGSVGDTALCETNEPPHLHFAMSLNGVSADPAQYLP